MTSINDAYQGRRHRYVYGYHSVFEPGPAPGQAPAGGSETSSKGGSSSKGASSSKGGSKGSQVSAPQPPVDAPQIGVAKVDTDTREVEVWLPGACQFALEPKFVARPGATAEDDGWLLCMLFDSGARWRGAGGDAPMRPGAWLLDAWGWTV